ncbi:VanZ family protein, partial [Weissella soli]|uniref:VanZ family protein n=1 Tax=Weissella soli TaxID=155866 RepID=UPI0035A18AA0
MKKINSEIVWLAIAFGVMAVLFFSSSQTYAEQSQQGNLRHWLVNQPFKEFLAQFKFTYAGEVEDAAKNYFTYVEFLMRKTAHFSTYFIFRIELVYGVTPTNRQSFVSWFCGLASGDWLCR